MNLKRLWSVLDYPAIRNGKKKQHSCTRCNGMGHAIYRIIDMTLNSADNQVALCSLPCANEAYQPWSNAWRAYCLSFAASLRRNPGDFTIEFHNGRT